MGIISHFWQSCLFFLVLSILKPNISLTQNLVLNPGFEQHEVCPKTFTIKHRSKIVTHWFSPSKGTPDYYNKCSSGISGVPKNWSGDSQPVRGEGYIGMYLWKKSGFREYIQGYFTQPLEKGITYKIIIHVSQVLNAHYQIGNIDLLVTKDSTFNFSNDYILIPDTVYLSSKLPFNSIQDWETIEWEYQAVGGEISMVIGNYKSQGETSLKVSQMRLKEEPMLDSSAYVLIDEVSVTKEEDATIPFVQRVVLSDVNFEFNKHDLSVYGVELLNSVIQNVKKSYTLKVIGHTDSVGDAEYNLSLGYLRAKSVKDYLVDNGVTNSIELLSEGEQKPIDSNATEQGRKKNRRVELIFSNVE